MAKDSLDKVKSAEISAKEIIEKAKADAVLIIEKAESDKLLKMKEFDDELKEKNLEFLKETEIKGNEIKATVSKETKKHVDVLDTMAKRNSEQAVMSVLELILN